MAIGIRRLGPGDEGLLESLAGEADDFDLAGASAPETPLAPDEAAGLPRPDPSVLHWIAEDEGVLVGELLCHVLRLPSGTAGSSCCTPSAFAPHTAGAASAPRSSVRCSAGLSRRASAWSGCSPTIPERRRPSTPPAVSPVAAKGSRAS